MNYNAIPVIRKGTFIRKEEFGGILIPFSGNINSTITVNGVGYSILKLCDGKRSILDIVESLKIEFQDNDTKKILKDVVNFIITMKKRQILYCNLDDKISKGICIYKDENYGIYKCGLDDIKVINNFLYKDNRSLLIGDNFIFDRSSISENINNFYILKNKNGDLISILNLNNISKINNIFNIKYLDTTILDFDLICKFINLCIMFSLKALNNKFAKIRIGIKSTVNPNFLNKIKNIGFNEVAILKHEFGLNNDSLIFEKLI